MLLDVNKFIKLVQRYGVAEAFVLIALLYIQRKSAGQH